jgi:hypothetical protein
MIEREEDAEARGKGKGRGQAIVLAEKEKIRRGDSTTPDTAVAQQGTMD